MSRRVVSSTVLVAVCVLMVVVTMAHAGRAPAPRDVQAVQATPVQASPTMEGIVEQAKLIGPSLERHPVPPVSMPAGWACPGTEGVENVHVALGAPPDYFALGKAMGLTDAEASAYAAGEAAAQQAMQEQMMRTIATLPPPPCP